MLLNTIFLTIASISTQKTYALLSDVKDQLDVVPYTADQRVQIAQSMTNMFSIYVNRQSKLVNYQKEYPKIDPIPRVAAILANATQMKDMEFHYAFVDIFMSLRDFHTNYFIPGPHGCVMAMKAVSFTVIGEGGLQKVVARGRTLNTEILNLSFEADRIDKGDELISIDGIPIQKYLHDLRFSTGGANEFGSLRAALSALSVVSGKTNRFPTTYSNLYQFLSTTGQEYEVNLPWIAATQSDCWAQSRAITDSLKANITISSLVPPLPPKERKPNMLIMVNPAVEVFKQTFGANSQLSGLKVNPTADPIIFWAIHAQDTKNMGIIYMESFVPLYSQSVRVTNLIRGLLTDELKETDALVFDIRSNGGGIITMADMIPQLFASDVSTTSARALVTAINEDIFLNSSRSLIDEWSKAYENVMPGDYYTPLVKFTENQEANRIGQAYVKPVGVFTNGNCYSSCDMFAANMKDNRIATVFGEDGRTGAGGANVIEYASFLSAQKPNHFPPTPFKNQMSLSAQNFRVGWRQTVRIDKSLIEDVGVVSDYVIRPTIPDLIPGSGSSSQYDRIADILLQQGIDTGKNKLYLQIEPQNNIRAIIGEPLNFFIDSSGYKTIAVYDESGYQLGYQNFDYTKRLQQNLTIITDTNNMALERYNVKAFNSSGQAVFSTWRLFRFVPPIADYLEITKNITIDLSSISKYSGIYEDIRKIGSGWNKVEGGLQVGDGVKYENNVKSTASYFLSLKKVHSIVVKATYDTEIDCDFLKIGYVRDNEVTFLLKSTSGDQGKYGVSGKGIVKETFELPAGELEFFIIFESDVAIVSQGVTIESLAIIEK